VSGFVTPAIEAIVFDFGGVMVSFRDLGSFQEQEARLGLEPGELNEILWGSPEWQAAQVGGITDEQFWQRMGIRLGLHSQQEIDRFLDVLFRDSVADLRMVDLVRRVPRRYRTGLLSNASDVLPRLLRERYGLEGLFDVVVISALVGVAKPDPAIYRLLLERLGTQPEATVFVDDREANIVQAVALGIQGIQFEGYEALVRALRGRGVALA
jgi:epoxide hydrolase-like predicted phosphatase